MLTLKKKAHLLFYKNFLLITSITKGILSFYFFIKVPVYISFQLNCIQNWVTRIWFQNFYFIGQRVPLSTYFNMPTIPRLGRSPGEGKGYPLQYSGLENCVNCIVHGVAKSQTQLSNFHFTSFNIDILIRLIPEMISTKVILLFG